MYKKCTCCGELKVVHTWIAGEYWCCEWCAINQDCNKCPKTKCEFNLKWNGGR